MSAYSDVLRGLVFNGDKDSVVSLLKSKEIPKNSLKPLKGLPHGSATAPAPAPAPALIESEPVSQNSAPRRNGESSVALYVGIALIAAGAVYFYTKNRKNG